MRIAINLLGQTYNRAGTGWYISSVLTELAKIDKTNEYLLFMPKGYEDVFAVKQSNFKILILNCPRNTILRRAYEQFILPFKISLSKPNIVFSTNNVCPLLLGKMNTLLLYDMARWHFRESNILISFYQKALIYLSAKVAGKIVTISEFSKEEIVNISHVPPEKIYITYAGVREKDFMSKENDILEQLGINGEYIIAIGSIESRKNHVGLIKAFEIADLPLKLVIVGKAGDSYHKVVEAIEKSPRKADIYLTGYVSQEASGYLVSKAMFYATATLFEGAGMATLEVMGRGKAAVASDLPAIREYCGDAIVSVDPNDVGSIAHGLKLLYTDNNLRNKLEKEGVKQSLKFSWKENAEKLLEIWKK